jgi:outer membrane protein OmpA-like peptidoglycan-associated protein
MNIKTGPLAVVMALVLAGCATDDPNRRAKTGAAVGAVLGAVLGHQLDDDSGAIVGAVVGAVAGGAVGHYMDNQQREFEAALAEEQRLNQIEIERLEDDLLKINLSNEVSFGFDSAQLKPAFLKTLDKVSDVLRRFDRSIVHVIGHTDSVGAERYNQSLSERRAQSVADYMSRQGVSLGRLRTEGRGELEPRDSNTTEAGRQLNRRVELIIKPVVAGHESDAYQAP